MAAALSARAARCRPYSRTPVGKVSPLRRSGNPVPAGYTTGVARRPRCTRTRPLTQPSPSRRVSSLYISSRRFSRGVEFQTRLMQGKRALLGPASSPFLPGRLPLGGPRCFYRGFARRGFPTAAERASGASAAASCGMASIDARSGSASNITVRARRDSGWPCPGPYCRITRRLVGGSLGPSPTDWRRARPERTVFLSGSPAPRGRRGKPAGNGRERRRRRDTVMARTYMHTHTAARPRRRARPLIVPSPCAQPRGCSPSPRLPTRFIFSFHRSVSLVNHIFTDDGKVDI